MTHVLMRPRLAAFAGVDEVTDRGRRQHGGERRAAAPSGGELVGLGISLALALVLPAAAGLGADALLHSSPVGLLAGLLIGIGAACVSAVLQFRRYL